MSRPERELTHDEMTEVVRRTMFGSDPLGDDIDEQVFFDNPMIAHKPNGYRAIALGNHMAGSHPRYHANYSSTYGKCGVLVMETLADVEQGRFTCRGCDGTGSFHDDFYTGSVRASFINFWNDEVLTYEEAS